MTTQKKEEILTWNTRRPYSEHGQRMAATKLQNGKVAFVDIDRGLSYTTTKVCPGPVTQAFVMGCYDNNDTERLSPHLIYPEDLEAAARKLP